MIQLIVIGLLVLGAIFFLGRLVYRSFTSHSCETGCNKCGTIDVDSIVKAMEKRTTPKL